MRPVPIRNPFRRLGDRAAIDGRGADLIKAATARGTVQSRPQALQIPAARYDGSTYDGPDVYGGSLLALYGAGQYSTEGEVYR